MTKKKTNPKEACQGRYYVSGYETADGKKVDGYYRTCWKHGTNGNSVQETDTLDDTINGPYYPKTLPTKANDGLPLPSPNTPGKINTGQSHPVWDIISQTIGVASDIFLTYMAYQAAANKNVVSFYPVVPNYSDNENNINTLNVESTSQKFDIKKTEEKIKEAMNNVSGLMKKKQISTTDIANVRNSALNSIKTICDDMEYLSNKKSQLPETPTTESVEQNKNIENYRKQTRENTYQTILMMNQANKALEKSFEPVNTTDSNYGEKLKNYLHEKETFKKINENLNSLYDISEKINNNTKGKIERIKENLNIPNSTYDGITGGAASIEENNNTYKVDNKTNQKIFNKITNIELSITELNVEMENINKSNTKISKEKILKIYKKLEEIIKDIEKYYTISLKADEVERQEFQWKKNTLKYWFDKVLNQLPRTFNNSKRILLKFKHSDTHVEDIQLIQSNIEEIEQLLPKTITSNITLGKKIIEDIRYILMKIIDNIRYRFIELEEEPIPEEILEKYPKPQNMSKENEAIFDYAIRNLYNVDNVSIIENDIKNNEEFKPYVYDDQNPNVELKKGDIIIGYASIGYGFRDINGVPVEPGKTKSMSRQEADIYLHKIVINRYGRELSKSVKVPLTQGQYDALLDLVYNIGPYNLDKRSIIILLNNGDYISAYNEFDKYIKSKGKIMPGLVERRKRDKILFQKGLEEIFEKNQ